ncbi:uncharacterized protein PGRI_089010 [Penicillium griseofulvum]|uniref:Uncharacterized protein n=1 Tax=Penicillium patulum TaxID=5078 RepID=A0A135LRA3_PENPA|nr:uncharacterized protein PGRI_089010 [Penicillium griseofulvum]KXG51508.1 hypothetical protein PGRI_089010 [Penicillium griseofulvum]
MSERQRTPRTPFRQHVRAQLSTSAPQFLFCLTCVQLNVIGWMQAGTEYGFGPRFEFRCVQDSGNSNDCQNCAQEDQTCEQVPAGIEGHRYELLSLIAWVNLMWGSYDPTRPYFDGFERNWILPGHALAQLGAKIANLCQSFRLLAQNHIEEHGIHSTCSRARRAVYRNWLLSRQPIPCAIELDGSPERFADFSSSKHKSADTEDHVHYWYGAIRSFRQSVTGIIEDGVRGTIHQDDYAALLRRFPSQILPAFPRGFQ